MLYSLILFHIKNKKLVQYVIKVLMLQVNSRLTYFGESYVYKIKEIVMKGLGRPF